MPGVPDNADNNVRSPFSRPLKVEDVPPEGIDVTISATEAERQAIAAENGLERLAKLEGALRIELWRKGGLAVTGEMRARVTQICVVSLDAFDSEIVEPIDAKFAPAGAPAIGVEMARRAKKAPRRRSPPPEVPARAPEFEGDDPPDPISEGRIDLGALVAEFLALGLAPYPRKPGVEFDEAPLGTGDQIRESPFAKLAALKETGGSS
jgi:hypothetical protein